MFRLLRRDTVFVRICSTLDLSSENNDTRRQKKEKKFRTLHFSFNVRIKKGERLGS